MGPMKSQAEFYLNLCTRLIASDPLARTPHRSLMRDIQTVTSRFAHEGLSFLTKTLPKLGKALDLGLVEMKFTPIREFSSQKGGSRPEFLQVYFNLIFSEDGLLLEEADPLAVKHLRQILFYAYKLELPYDPAQESAVVSRFKETDIGLELAVRTSEPILGLASRITEGVFKGFDPMDILPRHGPGAVATGEKLEEKWVFSRKYSSIHQVYPYYDYFVVGRGPEIIDRLEWYKGLTPAKSGCSKVVLVPKDSRGPRLIAAEPLEYQWLQQGLGRKMASHLEAQRLTRGHVNFTNQEINRSLALSSSSTQSYSTLDLKDASDRVSLHLVREVFKSTPRLLRCLEALRSTETLLPDGEVIQLQKYAPMGSALCFPVEAYIFWVLIVSAMVMEARLPLRRVVSSVYVFGDDIIVPTEWTERCIQVLESAGLVVNRQKSCITGSFRESCGMDAFRGVPVTPLRLKKPFSGSSRDGTALAAYTEWVNALPVCYATAKEYCVSVLESVYGVLPLGTSFASYPHLLHNDASECDEYNSKHFKSRWNSRYQRREFRLPVVLPVHKESELDGWTRLLRNMCSGMGGEPSRVVVPRSTLIKRGWRAVY